MRFSRPTLTLQAAVVSIGPWVADYNETHIFNPLWSAHAEFHVAQTLFLATISGLAALWLLQGPGACRRATALGRWRGAAFCVSIYWSTILPAILVPGTAHTDEQFSDRLPVLFGVAVDQTAIAVV